MSDTVTALPLKTEVKEENGTFEDNAHIEPCKEEVGDDNDETDTLSAKTEIKEVWSFCDNISYSHFSAPRRYSGSPSILLCRSEAFEYGRKWIFRNIYLHHTRTPIYVR